MKKQKSKFVGVKGDWDWAGIGLRYTEIKSL